MIPRFDARSYEHSDYPTARNFIGGEWVDPTGSHVEPIINPRDGRAMSDVRFSTAGDVAKAVAAATAAQKDWGTWPLRERALVMYKARDLMMRDVEELSWLLSHENGKLYDEAKAEVLKGIECVEFGCSLPNLAAGNQLEVSRGVNCELRYEPLGVVAGVVPFNFPFMVPLWMLPQALVGGNAFLLKPSEQVPLCSLKLASIFGEAGLPPGILNLVQGGREVVEALCDHEGISALAFVGSTRVAKIVYGRAAATGKRALCLGGAKNHLIVVPDADLEVASQNIVASFTGCSGQRCMAASVLVAVGDGCARSSSRRSSVTSRSSTSGCWLFPEFAHAAPIYRQRGASSGIGWRCRAAQRAHRPIFAPLAKKYGCYIQTGSFLEVRSPIMARCRCSMRPCSIGPAWCD